MSSVEVLETPVKSENDKKSYRLIRLENGLKALLISTSSEQTSSTEHSANDNQHEPDTAGDDGDVHEIDEQKLAACALCVDVGHFSNPPDVQGLAHFLEHLIFMGSEKYPNEDEFKQFLQNSSGSENAHTRADTTTFYFEVQEQSLGDALDRFSHLFKAPLLRADSMMREREAVDSEFSMGKCNEFIQRRQILASLAQPAHPFSKLGCGNLKTLKDDIGDEVLHQKVHEFRRRHYSAHRMCVCVQAECTLDSLQQMIVKHFSTIPNNEMPGDDFSQFNYQNTFQPKFYEKVYFVQQTGNNHRIDISWSIRPIIQNFKCKPDSFVDGLLRREGHGSLHTYLREKQWANELTAGTDEQTKLFATFSLNISLTDDGFDHLDQVLEAIFSYLKFLQLNGLNETLFREVQAIKQNSFDFAADEGARFNVENLALNMCQYPSEYIQTAKCLYFEYNSDAIREFIDDLNSRKFNIMITSNRPYNDQVTFESIEPWYGAKYTELDMPAKWIDLWENAKPFPEFALPAPNPFIADDFTIFFDAAGSPVPYPTKILDNDLAELWFRQDDKFLLPTAYYKFQFVSPEVIASPKGASLMALLSRMLRYQFEGKLYPAQLADLFFDCSRTTTGLIFYVSGFNQKLHLVVAKFNECLKSLLSNPTESDFSMAIQQQLTLNERDLLEPEMLSSDLGASLGQSKVPPIYERVKYFRSATFIEFREFCRKFSAEMRIKALIQGNVTESHARNVMDGMLSALSFNKIEDPSSVRLEALKLPLGSNYLRCENLNARDINSSILNIYQIGPYSYETRALLDLMEQVAEVPLFHHLRTTEQLAYVVWIDAYEVQNNLRYEIRVDSQETKFAAEYVDERIENFRRILMTTIEEISDDEFDSIKKTLAANKLKEFNELSEEVRSNWKEIETNRYDFDRRHKEVACLSIITKDQLLDFYRAHYGQNERKLSIQVIGNAHGNESNETEEEVQQNNNGFDGLTYVAFKGESKGHLIEDFMAFKNSLEVYLVEEDSVNV